jgi:hypothetical protein
LATNPGGASVLVERPDKKSHKIAGSDVAACSRTIIEGTNGGLARCKVTVSRVHEPTSALSKGFFPSRRHKGAHFFLETSDADRGRLAKRKTMVVWWFDSEARLPLTPAAVY